MRRDEPAFPSFAKLQAAGWLGLYVLVLVAVLPYVGLHPGIIRDNAVMIAAWFLASCALRFACRSLRRRSLPWLPLALSVAAWSLVLGSVSTAGAFLVTAHMSAATRGTWTDFLRSALQSWVLMLFWCSLYFGIQQWRQSTQDREHRLQAEAAAREAKLGALRYQLNPHFLFNTLNAVTTLVLEGDTAAAAEMLARIAALLRASLDGSLGEVSLSQEMALTERYLAIEQVRLGERLRVATYIPAATRAARVPSLLLQPIAENAVRHGVAAESGPGTITIRSEVRAGRLRLTVANSGPSRRAVPSRHGRAGGIGLANTAERLRTLYGDDHGFVLTWPEAGGCEVLVELPFRTGSDPAEVPECVH
jgi:two-component system, LytTR family, sensor kinase